jgi:hypothetical protein
MSFLFRGAPVYSNFWMFVAIAATGAGAVFSVGARDYGSAGIFACLYLIASGIDRQVGLDRRKDEQHDVEVRDRRWKPRKIG